MAWLMTLGRGGEGVWEGDGGAIGGGIGVWCWVGRMGRRVQDGRHFLVACTSDIYSIDYT